MPIIREHIGRWEVRIYLFFDGLDIDFVIVDDGACDIVGVGAVLS